MVRKIAYFSLAPALIHGIHIVPINPSTSLIRPRSFVKEEWETFFTEVRNSTKKAPPSSSPRPHR
jgi:endo-1,3(4)-beta-glucanase